ncbi:hypothetical protein [Paenibacillus gorillae]|uniref:hypothetical protein n=1 Tax=Paenibacillus gorillae TaxID=1243662 RepID=UPI0004AF9897|nr:hypothetical protein [Paenibacillus gorillae]
MMTSKNNNIETGQGQGAVKTPPNDKLGGKKTAAVVAVMAAVIVGAGILFFVMMTALQAKSDRMEDFPSSYTYATATSAGGMELHVLATKPSNVTLTAIHNNVSISPFYGINGGFSTIRLYLASPSLIVCQSMEPLAIMAQAMKISNMLAARWYGTGRPISCQFRLPARHRN